MLTSQNNDPDQVRRCTSEEQLRRIDEKTLRNIRVYAVQPPKIIEARINELRSEWTIDRIMQMNIAAVGLTTALLAITQNRKWGLATCMSLGFFLLYATKGFAPPVPLLRELGIRTRNEIDREIFALKVIRGDFSDVEPTEPAESPEVSAALRAVGV